MFGFLAATAVGVGATTPLMIAFSYLRLAAHLPTLTALAIPVAGAIVAIALISTVLGLRGRRLVTFA